MITRIITFLVGDPYKPSFTTVTVRGVISNIYIYNYIYIIYLYVYIYIYMQILYYERRNWDRHPLTFTELDHGGFCFNCCIGWYPKCRCNQTATLKDSEAWSHPESENSPLGNGKQSNVQRQKSSKLSFVASIKQSICRLHTGESLFFKSQSLGFSFSCGFTHITDQ